MNREEMLKRLQAGEDPLDLSIRKWQDIVDGKGMDLGENNCALCEVYNPEDSGRLCSGCPVNKKTKRMACEDTPYDTYSNAFHDQAVGRRSVSAKELKGLAQLEVDFLKGLKENLKK